MPEPTDSGATPTDETGPESTAEGATPQPDQRDAADTGQDNSDDTPLQPQGRRALTEERQARQKAEEQLKQVRKQLSELTEANQTEQERAVSKARREGYDEAVKLANSRLVKAEARALAAAAGWRDPADALLYVEPDAIKVTDSGDVDSDALKSALSEIAKSKPYLLAENDAKPSRPRSSRPDPVKNGKDSSPKPDMENWLRSRARSSR